MTIRRSAALDRLKRWEVEDLVENFLFLTGTGEHVDRVLPRLGTSAVRLYGLLKDVDLPERTRLELRAAVQRERNEKRERDTAGA